MKEYSFLKQCIVSEGGFPLSEKILDRLLDMGEKIELQAQDYIIAPDIIDRSIWITASGVTKAVYFDGKKEIVLGFSGPGTLTISPLSYMLYKPSFCAFQAITDCKMLKIRKEDFDRLMHESNEFTRWMFGILMGQFCALELKAQMLSHGDIYTNYKQLIKRQMRLDEDGFDPNRPSLLNIISSKDLASYLGITQSYLSNIRKAIIDQERAKDENNELFDLT